MLCSQDIRVVLRRLARQCVECCLTEVDCDSFVLSVFVDVDESSRSNHPGTNSVQQNSDNDRRVRHWTVRGRRGWPQSVAWIVVWRRERAGLPRRTQLRQKVLHHVWNGSRAVRRRQAGDVGLKVGGRRLVSVWCGDVVQRCSGASALDEERNRTDETPDSADEGPGEHQQRLVTATTKQRHERQRHNDPCQLYPGDQAQLTTGQEVLTTNLVLDTTQISAKCGEQAQHGRIEDNEVGQVTAGPLVAEDWY